MKKFTPYSHWTTEFCEFGCFDHLNTLVELDEWQSWPSCEGLQSLFPRPVSNLNGLAISFVDQEKEVDYSAVAYETYVYETGKVPTRKHSWHDVFGALTWSLFPKSKARLNSLHYHDIKQQQNNERSKLRNALTLFDECGVVLVTENSELIEALRNHQWLTAFWQMRDCWHSAAKSGVLVYNFGHANYEMLTKPFIGLTGKILAINKSAEMGQLPLNVQYRLLDEALDKVIIDGALQDNSKLTPLPLLGIPGWHDDNQKQEYYLNTDYFRPKRD